MMYLWNSENNFWALSLSTMVDLELMWVLSPPAWCGDYKHHHLLLKKRKTLLSSTYRSDLDAIVRLSQSL